MIAEKTNLHRGSILLLLPIFSDVLEPAREYRAQLVEGLRFDIFIRAQPPNRLAVNPALLSEHVGGHPFFLHGVPKPVKNNHINPPIPTALVWGL